MKLIELHILQSFPVSCLNRDDVGAPKTAVFGGVNRARLSSQSLKRAIREHAAELLPARFAGERTKLVASAIQKQLVQKHGLSEERALQIACAVAGVINKKDGKPLEIESPTLETLFFTSPKQTEALADAAFNAFGATGEIKADKKAFVKTVAEAGVAYDAADIALFGRMVASDASLTLEGAAMFSHALSTHRADNDLDFYTAVDDRKPAGDDAGAGMMGTLEFASAVYYRYAALNLDLLADAAHLGKLTSAERAEIVDIFIRAALMAVPGARKNSMNAHTLPGYVLGTFKAKGQPVQLVNAFEQPVAARNGLLAASRKALEEHHAALKSTWGLKVDTEIALPDSNLDAFCAALTRHVC